MKAIRIKVCLLILGLIISGTTCARILCVFSIPAFSHQSVFKAYSQGLASQGHELVILTPNPSLPKDRPPDNITEIDVGPISYNIRSNILSVKELFKRGVVMDLEALLHDSIRSFYTEICVEQLKHLDMMKIIKDPHQRFDLIVIESSVDVHLILSHFFKAPVIMISSYYGYGNNHGIMGSISKHPVLYPDRHQSKIPVKTLWDKLRSLYWEWRLMKHYSRTEEVGHDLLKAEFGPNIPTFHELRDNVAMLLLNVHHIYDSNRPVPPSVKYLGGLHLKPPKDIPQDLKTYLDHSKNGTVYVSFGTFFDISAMDDDLFEELIQAFQILPYDILWKCDRVQIPNMPSNIRVQQWFPQRDLLMHPNIKAFITQGGIQSIDEAIDAAVPIVGIPALADQWYNMYKNEQFGIGIQLDMLTLTADDIVKAVNTVISNERYKLNILKLREMLQDQPETPMQRAIWWTEHVLRHKGARHLWAASANVTWTEFLMLDLVVILFFIFTLSILAFYIIIQLFRRHFRLSIIKSENTKLKCQ